MEVGHILVQHRFQLVFHLLLLLCIPGRVHQRESVIRLDFIEQVADGKALFGVPFLPALPRHNQRIGKLQQGRYLIRLKIMLHLQIVVGFGQTLEQICVQNFRPALFCPSGNGVFQKAFVDLLHQRALCFIVHGCLPPFPIFL